MTISPKTPVLVAVLILGMAFLAASAYLGNAVAWRQPINASSDGRYHSCGLVTEDGVTDHLAAYRIRCQP